MGIFSKKKDKETQGQDGGRRFREAVDLRTGERVFGDWTFGEWQ